MELVLVKNFNTEIEAELIKAYMESKGLMAYVFGNVLSTTYNVFDTKSGGVQLKVAAENFDRAVELIDHYFNGEPGQEIDEF